MKSSLVAMVAMLFAGCGALGGFDIDLPSDTVIPSLTGSFKDPYAVGSVPTTIQQTIANKGVKPGQIKSAKITAGSLSVSADDAQYFDHVASYEIDIESPGLPKVRIAHYEAPATVPNPPVNKASFVLDAVEMKAYLTAASVTFSSVSMFTTPPPPDRDRPLHIDLTLHIQVL